MAEKELRKMRRNELIDIIYALQEQMEQVAAERDTYKKQLGDRQIHIEKAGSIADAAVALNHLFEVAQSTADQYLDYIYAANAEAEAQRQQILDEAHRQAGEILEAAAAEARQIEADRKDADLEDDAEA